MNRLAFIFFKMKKLIMMIIIIIQGRVILNKKKLRINPYVQVWKIRIDD